MNLPAKSNNLANNFRGAGYILETALADLIDNSIYAKSTNVFINLIWDESDSYIEIIDDGDGMLRNDLIKAMTWCEVPTTEDRDKSDLGRFGLGLKTASFSQARRFTVTSWREGEHYSMCWDLDTMGSNWHCECSDEGLITPSQALDAIKVNPKSGTHVLWTNLDSLNTEFGMVDLQRQGEADFYNAIDYTQNHLKLHFHRLLNSNFNIYVNNQKVEKFDPFFANHDATQRYEENISIAQKGTIKITAYLLPYKDKCNKKDLKIMNSGKGLFDTQGFYVFRNKRLISFGNWFSLFAKSEATKYARVVIDLPNTMDDIWEIDILKKEASPPRNIRNKLKSILPLIVDKGKGRHRTRAIRTGQNITGSKEPFWLRKTSGSKVSYLVNLENKLVSESVAKNETLKTLFCLLEKEFPFDSVYNDKVSDSTFDTDYLSNEEKQQAVEFAKFFIDKGAKKNDLANLEIFNKSPELLNYVKENI